ncbi:Lrp/AsnC family transcriptional regulator [Microbacterium karelineae]|uniref:Lrp/AsnC family transcriptional regulator n=1 Tax=Microbacterium karelineae TaxID=2654283 RepID=UPI0012EA14EF|nr:Lrp/AsnC family transcriptional regulator [Microbacterium karelineae]
MDLDADLIRALQEDGRASIHALSMRLGHSRATVSARLHELLAGGAVRVVAAVDPAFLGHHVLAHVSIRTDGSVEPVAAHLRGVSETVLVSAVGGAFDLVTEVRAASTPDLHALLAEIRRLPDVTDISTLIYVAVIKGFFVSEYRGDLVIDDTDMSLIELLQRDGRMSYRALGEAVRLSPSAVTTRVRRLVTGGVITISAVEARGLAHRQLSMGVGLTLDADDEAVLDALREDRGVDFAARTLGRFDAVATLVGPTAGALFESLERLRSLPGVARVETWLHLAVLKEDYARALRPAGA